jgi:hypothetical protein
MAEGSCHPQSVTRFFPMPSVLAKPSQYWRYTETAQSLVRQFE